MKLKKIQKVQSKSTKDKTEEKNLKNLELCGQEKEKLANDSFAREMKQLQNNFFSFCLIKRLSSRDYCIFKCFAIKIGLFA